MSKIDWILEQHKSTNHQYDTYLPYEFHLRMVSNTAQEFIESVPNRNDGENGQKDQKQIHGKGRIKL